jgi:hypothetical protein
MGYSEEEQGSSIFYDLGGLNIPCHVGNVNIYRPASNILGNGL